MAETGRTNPVHVGEQVYPYGTMLNRVGTDTKGKRGYPWYRAAGGCMKIGGGDDGYPDLNSVTIPRCLA